MTGRDEWTAYTEIGRAGIEQARAALAQSEPPTPDVSPRPPVGTPSMSDFDPDNTT